ncbi:GatB/YqeY domain-containing protein [Candidatus Shapirobacteria bacterium]|nr:GatB/YqeY domain-containing protein [Candidatus Shapirobacteria bacterium]
MLKDKLKNDAVVALKNRDQPRVGVLRFLISLIDKKEMQLPPGGMVEADEVNVLRKELKNKEESREMFVKGNRDDLVKELDYEIAVVKEYLPIEMDESEVEKIVDEVLAQNTGVVNFGMVMGQVMKKVAGRVGGEIVTRIVKEKLAS